MRVLIVKTSSMGDVVHALPAISDMATALPALEIDWLVEPAYAPIPRLHANVARVVPLAWRRWRRRLWSASTWRSLAQARHELRRRRYDLVLDLQGLLKSALWARQAQAPLAGYDRASVREPLAAWLYQKVAAVPRELHAIDRCRQLAALHLGYPLPRQPPRFGLSVPPAAWRPTAPYAVLIPNASRAAKLWPERRWVVVGQRLARAGWLPIVLWGSEAEQTLAERIAAGCEGDVPPFLAVGEMAALLAQARLVVGLDTGFTHLAAAVGRPTIGIYCDHEPGLAGLVGPGPVSSLGGKGSVPAQAEVLARVEEELARG